MPYERNAFFIGRDDLLDNLHLALTQNNAAALTQAIYGLGGVGKTQTAVEYAYRHFYDKPDYNAVFWVRAETTEEIQQGFVQIARSLKLLPEENTTPERVVPVVKAWLENPHNRGWLLVYDNADTPDLLRLVKCLRPQGTTLLTSRHHNFGVLGISKPLNVGAWNQEEAVAFLCKRTGRKLAELSEEEREAVTQITDMLGGLPLALEQAGAYIVARDTTFAVYCDEYQKRAAKLLREPKPETGDYRDHDTNEYRTVWTTWDLNFQAVQADSPASTEVLTFSAFLAPYSIPAELLLMGANHIGTATSAIIEQKGREWSTYDTFLEPLTRYSLVQKNSTTYTYTMHRLVQQVLRDRLDVPQRQAQAERVVHALYITYPGQDFDQWWRCERLLPHWLLGTEYVRNYALSFISASGLFNQIASYLNDHGLYTSAEPLYVQALDIVQKTLGEQHPYVATSLNNLAALYVLQGRYADAELLFKSALNSSNKGLPEHHPDIASTLNNLAELYQLQGRYADAEPLFVKALSIWEEFHSKQHPYIASILNNLARLYCTQGRFTDAEPLFLKALKIDLVASGENHPHYAVGLNNLAELYRSQSRYEEAEPLYLQALNIRCKVLPKYHPDIANSLSNLAILYYAQDRYSDAEPLYIQALEIQQKSLPEDHPTIAKSHNNIAMLYKKQGRYNEAEPLFVQVLDIMKRVLNDQHPYLATSLNNLAGLYELQGRYEDAEPLYVQALAIMQQALGEQHLDTQTIRRNLEIFRQKHRAKQPPQPVHPRQNLTQRRKRPPAKF